MHASVFTYAGRRHSFGGFRHGEGIVRLADGNYAKVTWGWGRQKSVSDSAPTDAEIEELEQRIKRFELLFGLIGH